MNDMILNLLANDSFTVSDFRAVGLSAENTKLESEEKYLQSQMIQENPIFQDDQGNFSEDIFHQYYLQATDFYNKLADETYLENITKNTFYSKDNIFAPKESPKIDELPRFVTSPNPFLQNNSLTRVGKRGDRQLSISEIAQSQKIYDSKTQTFKDESVNDRALGSNPFKWLGDLFSEPLVIAQWDEDGEHIDQLTGQVKTHKKGDYKYNDDGTFYYETLNGRDVYGRQVLNKMNTLTVDGSNANKYDFFDSDDLEQKSFIGNTLKNLALVGSMFLPVVGKPIIAASIATQSVGLLGALGKMFLGSENETVNNLHAWSKTVNRQAVTEYASQNTWCWENLINMIGDTVGQLAEQRFLFTHVPALFKGTKGIKARDSKTYQELVDKGAKEIQEKTNKDLIKSISKINASTREAAELEIQELTHQWKTMSTLKSQAALEKYMQSYNQLGSIMSKAYMTGITVQDTYGEAKANGASDIEALALTLGYAAGEAWILNTGLGEWIMPELHGDKLKYRAIINALKNEVKPLSNDVTEAATKEGRQNLFKKIFNIGKRVATDDYARQQFVSQTYNPMSVVLAHAAGEGFEEVSEELLADVSKSAFNAVNWLRGDETRIAGTWDNVIDRYGMSLLGGFIGGGVSSINTDFSYAQQLAKMTNESAIQEIVYMVNNDKIDDFLKFANKADLGNKHLSFDTDERGNFKSGTKENNQDKEIKQMLNAQVKLIKDVINAEGAKFSENSLFDALTLKDLRYAQLRNTATAGAFFQEYNSLITDIYKKSEEIRQLTGENTNTDTKKKELTDTEKGDLAKKKQELNDLRVRKDAITSGKRSPEFIATALYEAQEALHAHNRGYTFQGWAEAQTKKKFEELTEAEIKDLKPKYKAYRETEMKNDVIGDARQFVDLVGLASGAIQQQQDYLKIMQEEQQQNAAQVQVYLGNLFDGLNTLATSENFDVDAFIQKAQTDLASIIPGTAFELSSQLFDAETIARLQYIDSTPASQYYSEQDKKQDKILTIFEAFAEYADTITQQFIDQGYIHPEVKNNLLNTYQSALATLEKAGFLEQQNAQGGQFHLLQNLSPYSDKEDYEYEEVADERGNKFKSFIANLNNKIEQIKELHSTPIITLLENFKLATSESDTSVKDVMEYVNNLLNQSYEDIESFGYSDAIETQLDEISELIDTLASALYATRVDEAGIRNAWGYSKTLNELNKKYGNDQWVELTEIEGKTADLLMQDLALVKQKVHFAKNLRAVNNGQKLNKQAKVGYNKQFIFYNKLRNLFQLLPEQLSNWNLESLQKVLNEDLLLSRYGGKDWSKRKFSLTPEEKIRIEQEQLMVDDAIYQFFQDNSDKVKNIDELSKLINPKFFNLYDPATRLLSDEVEDLDDNQFVFELAAKAAVKSSDFYNALRKTFNDEKAPVPMQEQATYLNVAMVLNGDVVNNFARAYSKSLFQDFKDLTEARRKEVLGQLGYNVQTIQSYAENPESLKWDSVVEKFENIVLTEGIAGSGKTGGVFDSTVRIIKQINPDLLKNVFVVNSTIDNAKSLMDSMQLKGKTFSSSHAETEHDLLRYFYSDFTMDYDKKVTFKNNKLKHTFTLKEDLVDLPKIIFIDEASRYDYIQTKLLMEAAQHYGIVILAAGDFDQISARARLHHKPDDPNSFIDLSPARLNFIRSSKLGVSFRTLNSQMSKNQNEVLATINNDDKEDFNFYYWENDKEIRGFKIYEKSEWDSITASINKLKNNLKSGEKIGFLYADKEKSIYNKVKETYGDLIDGKSIEDAQGLEGNYYIVDLNHTSQDKANSDKKHEIYTGFTRSKQGGIIINDKSSLNLQLKNIREESSQLESITPDAIAKASQKRKTIFDTIFGDKDVTIEYHPITPVKKEVEVEELSDESEEEAGLAPSLPPTKTKEIPSGMYKTREAAKKVDLSTFISGLELYTKDDTLFGTIQDTNITEQTVDDETYYIPTVVVKKPDGSVVSIFAQGLSEYILKDPKNSMIVPKYNIGTILYDSEGNSIEIIEIDSNDSITYKIKDSNGNISTLSESELDEYSLKASEKSKLSTEDDLGENDDSELYKIKIEAENASNLQPSVESDGKIHHWMYTFNAYETGVLWDDEGHMRPEHFQEGNPIQERTMVRRDNVNGLLYCGAIGSNATKSNCMDILANIHSILMYNKDNGSVIQEITQLLGLPAGMIHSIQYGIKSSANISQKSKSEYGTTEGQKDWYVFDKHKDEVSEYAQPEVIEGDALSRKTIVALFRNDKGEKVLEITLGSLNSPITIGQIRDSKGDYIYPEIGTLLEQLRPGVDNDKVFEICSQAENICKEKGYTDLGNLFKAFLFTSNGFAPLSKAGEFNLASQSNTGPHVIGTKGQYQKNATRQYETKYVDLNEFIKDERIVVSDVWIPKTNEWAGKKQALHKGYPGVFVSYNKSYSKDDLAGIYMKQLSPDYKGTKDVEFYYVIPPEATAREYLKNFRNAYLNHIYGGTRSVRPIGNMWTSYKLLRNIYNGGDLTEDKFKSKILNQVELSTVVEYIKKLQDLETRTDWASDENYKKLVEDYKKLYSNERTAKKYAVRNIVLQKQSKILQEGFPDTKYQVHQVLTGYITNAAYWDKAENAQPQEHIFDIIDKHNPGTIKYKTTYLGTGKQEGMFVQASTTNTYSLETITEEGNLSSKGFQINSKIDPPIFEIEALTNAVGILAQWKYENPNNTSSRKVMENNLHKGTWGYLNNSTTSKEKNNFELLKSNNKLLFGDSGLFKDIKVVGENDPSYDQLHFAEEILTKFNSEPNNLGFAIVDSSGKVKLYAFKINELTKPLSLNETETYESLGNITINIPLIFRSKDDILTFNTPNRKYQVSLDGKNLVFTHVPNITEQIKTSKIIYTESNTLTQEMFDKAMNVLGRRKVQYNGQTVETLSNMPAENRLRFLRNLSDEIINNEDFKPFYEFMSQGPIGTVNVNIGDLVSLNETNFTAPIRVANIMGSLVILEDNTQIDITKQSLYKKEDNNIACPKTINIAYGK